MYLGGIRGFFQPFDRKLEAPEKIVCVSPKEFPCHPERCWQQSFKVKNVWYGLLLYVLGVPVQNAPELRHSW